MSLEHIIFIYLLVTIGGIAALTVLNELRKRHFRQEESKDTVFRCEKCGSVYTDDADVDRSRCSQCGQLNEAIEF